MNAINWREKKRKKEWKEKEKMKGSGALGMGFFLTALMWKGLWAFDVRANYFDSYYSCVIIIFITTVLSSSSWVTILHTEYNNSTEIGLWWALIDCFLHVLFGTRLQIQYFLLFIALKWNLSLAFDNISVSHWNMHKQSFLFRFMHL